MTDSQTEYERFLFAQAHDEQQGLIFAATIQTALDQQDARKDNLVTLFGPAPTTPDNGPEAA